MILQFFYYFDCSLIKFLFEMILDVFHLWNPQSHIHLSVKIQLIHTNKYQNRSMSRNHKIIIFWSVFVLCAKILSFVDITHTIAIFTWFQVFIPRETTTSIIYVVPPAIHLCHPSLVKQQLQVFLLYLQKSSCVVLLLSSSNFKQLCCTSRNPLPLNPYL